MRAIVVALSGPSASGKTTAVATLARREGWVPLDEAFYRLRPRPSLRIPTQAALRQLELRLLGEEARRFAEAQRIAADGRTVIADTSFLDPVGYTTGLLALGLASRPTFQAVVTRARDLARRHALGLPDLTVELTSSTASRAARAASDPTGHPRAFRHRHEVVGAAQRRGVLPWMRQRLPQRVRRVDARASPDAVIERIRAAAARTLPWDDPCRAAEALLAALARRPPLGPATVRSGKVKKATQSPRPPR